MVLTSTTQSNTYLLGIYRVIGITLEASADKKMTQLLPQAACNYTNGRDNS